ncbi:MAG: conjugal transfer protein TraF [Candidatus Parvarchaeum sp.]
MSRSIVITVFMLILGTVYQVQANVGHFYQGKDRYRGFYWFEDKAFLQESKTKEHHIPTPLEAEKAIEARRKIMDDARNQMIELAFRKDTPPQLLREAIVKYKKLEQEMYDGGIRLSNASDMANFTNPEIADQIELPTNVFANKLKRKIDEEEKIKTIREFADKFDLVLFANDDCPYCKAFLPVVNIFAKEYGFTLSVTGLDTPQGKIAANLGIKAVPTLVAISKDAGELFELARGFISLSELRDNAVLGHVYSMEKQRLAVKR